MKKIYLWLSLGMLLLLVSFPALGADFSLGVGMGSGDYTQGWGTIDMTYFSVVGEANLSSELSIFANYTASTKLHTYDSGDYALVIWDLGFKDKFIKGPIGSISGLLGYGKFEEHYSDDFDGADYSAYKGIYLGLAGELSLHPVTVGASYKYYLDPRSCGSKYDFYEQRNTRISVYDVYMAALVTRDLSLQVGYTFNDMYSKIPDGDLTYQVNDTYFRFVYKF